MKKKAAHFLNTANLYNSPPNDAIARSYRENGYHVDFFAPDTGDQEFIRSVEYGYRWLLKNLFSPRWFHYSAFSSTSEDPIVVAGVLAFIWRKPLIFLSDEIKSGSYSGDRSKVWKWFCRWAMRRASLTIVNDSSRVLLQGDYAALPLEKKIIIYPGCFLTPPQAMSRRKQREKWGIDPDKVVLGFSGACNLTAGIDWALDALDDNSDIEMVAQPLSLDPLNQYLLRNHRNIRQVYLESNRLSWQEAWSSMGGVDIGVAIYLNQAPQFQLMGISSNRLCMFLAMGVPVIVSRQDSFKFIEDYQCGVMVDNAQEFSQAISTIRSNLDNMKRNALKCAAEHIDTENKYRELVRQMKRAFN